MALGTILWARERGCAVPADWSVVGYDDSALRAYTDPPLTTVAQPMREIGEGTVRLLLEILEGKSDVTPVSITLPHTLMIRGSTAPMSGPSVGLRYRTVTLADPSAWPTLTSSGVSDVACRAAAAQRACQ